MDQETLNLISKYREYNPEYNRYTDQEITELGLPGFEQPMGINTIPNQFSYSNQFMNDMRNLPNDFRTSLGQTKDALVEDFRGLGSFLKDKSKTGFNFAKQIPAMAISAITGVPFLGQGLVSLLSGMKESPTDKVGLDYFGGSYDPYGYKSDLSSGNLGARQDPFGRNIVSAFSDYEKNRINELKELTQLQNLGILNNKFKQNKLDFAKNYLEKLEQERQKAIDESFENAPPGSKGNKGADFTGGRFDRAGSREAYDRDPTGFSGSS